MPRVKELNETDRYTLINHIELTKGELAKCYKISQLAYMEGKTTEQIKRSPRFVPVRVDWALSLSQYKSWAHRKAYGVKWIRLDEIEYLVSQKTWKNMRMMEAKVWGDIDRV